jgi:hypothetical protein
MPPPKLTHPKLAPPRLTARGIARPAFRVFARRPKTLKPVFANTFLESANKSAELVGHAALMFTSIHFGTQYLLARQARVDAEQRLEKREKLELEQRKKLELEQRKKLELEQRKKLELEQREE